MKRPPILQPETTSEVFWIPAVVCLAGLALLHSFPAISNAAPRCALRVFTGIPCPLCGGTRSMLAWSRLDVAEAFRLNPVAAMLPLVAVCWPMLRRFRPEAISLRLLFWLAAAIGVNWLYLCVTLPP